MRKSYADINPTIFKAAQLYVDGGLRQEDVAKALGVSRASVALYLQKAREAGLIETRLRPEIYRHHELAVEFEKRFGLAEVYISDSDGSKKEIIDNTLRLGANVLIDALGDGDRLGVAWGRTVHRLSELLPNAPQRNMTVMQLCGNLGAPFGHSPEESTNMIAKRLAATKRNLYAPLVVSSSKLAQELRCEPIIANQLDACGKCTKAIFTIGDCEEDSHLVQCGALTVSELRELVELGAHGVVAGRLISGEGKPMHYKGGDRVIGITLDHLRAIPFRLVVVVGIEKSEAVLASLRGGFATHIVLDRQLAEDVLLRASKTEFSKLPELV